MTKLQKKRLLRLADFIVTVPKENFDMDRFGTNGTVSLKPHLCTTAACALGWCPVLFKRLGVELGPTYQDRHGIGVGVSLFGLTYEQSEMLFLPKKMGQTAKQVRRNILRLVAKLEKESNA